MKSGLMGEELIPGRNVNRVDIAAGIDAGTEFGYDSWQDETVTEYALARWARGEEDGAIRTWLSYHPHRLMDWYAILATAVASAEKETGERRPAGD